MPASPTTSGTELVATATTAALAAMPSHSVSPKPSYSDALTTIAAVR